MSQPAGHDHGDDPVLYEERDHIAVITLNRPEKKNTLNDAVIQGVADGIDAASRSAGVAAVVLRGAGDTLTAGYDLTAGAGSAGWDTPYGAEAPEARDGAWDPVRDYQFMHNNVRRFMTIWDCPKPVLGEIKGWAVGGATDLVLCWRPPLHGRRRPHRLRPQPDLRPPRPRCSGSTASGSSTPSSTS